MKKDIHPQTTKTIFKDISTGDVFLADTTLKTKKTITHTDGEEYQLVETEITSASHPFYTGTQKLVDTAGRIERFRKKFNITE